MTSSLDARRVYTSGDWDIDLARRELRLRGVPNALGERAFEIVEILVQSAGELVDKYDLMHAVWPGAVVEENTLHAHMSAIRKALRHDRELLKTVPGRGYRLLGEWTVRQDGSPAVAGGKKAVVPPPTSLTNLPSPATALIGRTSAVAHLVELLSANRTVTLTGPGGIGKTALALETAHTVLATFAGAARFVDLAPVSNSALVSSTVASALDIRSDGAELSQASLALALGSKPALVVMDNCEHVIDAAAKIAETILRACPRVHVLATSREVLRIEGEVVFRVSPLSVPDEHEHNLEFVLASSAARLFVDRTRALSASFEPDNNSAAAIAAICRRLDGIPLALEIAAARVATLGLSQVSSRLDGQFVHLVGGRRTALPRQQTLRATLDWSYALLSEAERAMLRRLSIFAGHFTMSSAMEVAAGNGVEVAQIPDLVASLVMKSLLSTNVGGVDSQYRMLQTTRDFGLELLRAGGEYDVFARSHAANCCDEINDAEADSNTLTESQWLQRYGARLDDVRCALDWSLEQGRDLELGATLTALAIALWTRLSLLNECLHYVRCALARVGSPAEADHRREMRLFAALANALMNTAGPVPEVVSSATRAREIAERIEDVDFQLRAIQTLWNGCFSKGEFQRSEQLALEFQRIAKTSPDPSDELLGHRLYATSRFFLGHLAEAQTHVERMLAGYADLPRDSNFARFGVAQLASAHALQLLISLMRGFPDQAMKMAEECVAEVLQTRNALTICSVVSSACITAAILAGDSKTAARYTSIVLQHAERAGLSTWHKIGQCFEAMLEIKTGNLSSGLRTLSNILSKTDPANVRYTHMFGDFADAIASAGDIERGIGVLDALLRSEQVVLKPDQLRRKAKLILMSGGPEAIEEAERTLWLALEKSRKQGARFFELGIAVNLALVLANRGQRESARDLLASVYEGFTEGFETEPLVAARRVLERLDSYGEPSVLTGV